MLISYRVSVCVQNPRIPAHGGNDSCSMHTHPRPPHLRDPAQALTQRPHFQMHGNEACHVACDLVTRDGFYIQNILPSLSPGRYLGRAANPLISMPILIHPIGSVPRGGGGGIYGSITASAPSTRLVITIEFLENPTPNQPRQSPTTTRSPQSGPSHPASHLPNRAGYSRSSRDDRAKPDQTKRAKHSKPSVRHASHWLLLPRTSRGAIQ